MCYFRQSVIYLSYSYNNRRLIRITRKIIFRPNTALKLKITTVDIWIYHTKRGKKLSFSYLWFF